MTFRHMDLKGSIFPNKDRDAERNQPTHTGSCVIEGIDYWMSGWVKESSNGKFLSVSFEKKDDKYQGGKQEPVPAANPEDFDEDIPF